METLFWFGTLVLSIFGIFFLVTLMQAMPIWPDQLPRELLPRPPLLNPPLPIPKLLFPLPMKRTVVRKAPIENPLPPEVGLASAKNTVRIGW